MCVAEALGWHCSGHVVVPPWSKAARTSPNLADPYAQVAISSSQACFGVFSGLFRRAALPRALRPARRSACAQPLVRACRRQRARIPPCRRCAPSSRPCFDFLCNICVSKAIPTSRLNGHPRQKRRPRTFDPRDPYLLAKRLESPPSRSLEDDTERARSDLQQQQYGEEEEDSVGQHSTGGGSPLSPTQPLLPFLRDLRQAPTVRPPPMADGPCHAGQNTGPTTTALFRPAEARGTDRTDLPPGAAAANTPAAWLTDATEAGTHAGRAGPQTVNIFTPRASGAPAAATTAVTAMKERMTTTTSAGREGRDPHAGAPGAHDDDDKGVPPTTRTYRPR